MANGFANRFLWVCSTRSKCLAFGGAVDSESLERLGEHLRGAVVFARGVERLAWAPEAAQEWERVYPQLSGSRPGLLGLVTARAEAQALRLALIYALLDKSAEIRFEHLRAALELWRYCADSAAYIFGQALGDSTADAIVSLLQTRPEGVTRTELTAHFDRNKSKAELDRAIALAQENGLLRMEKRETGGRAAVEVIAEIGSYAEYTIFSERLRKLGFREDTSEGAPLCRWKQDDLTLDVMPLDAAVLGFSNRWYPEALHTASQTQLRRESLSGPSLRPISW
jgi:hypothetical protein